MHSMPMDSDSLPRVVVTDIYNESLVISDNQSRPRSESIDGVKGMESISIYSLWGRALRARTRLIYRDNL